MDYQKESEMFDQAAEYYDQFRPSYPKNIIQTLVEKSGLTTSSKTLEIGAGSGKATELYGFVSVKGNQVEGGSGKWE